MFLLFHTRHVCTQRTVNIFNSLCIVQSYKMQGHKTLVGLYNIKHIQVSIHVVWIRSELVSRTSENRGQ